MFGSLNYFLPLGTHRTFVQYIIETLKQLDFAAGLVRTRPFDRTSKYLDESNVDLLCHIAMQGAPVEVVDSRFVQGASPANEVGAELQRSDLLRYTWYPWSSSQGYRQRTSWSCSMLCATAALQLVREPGIRRLLLRHVQRSRRRFQTPRTAPARDAEFVSLRSGSSSPSPARSPVPPARPHTPQIASRASPSVLPRKNHQLQSGGFLTVAEGREMVKRLKVTERKHATLR
ncbi:hypothetical protein PG994_009992 [Apiospora phragmitis]|uniref:Uncharacterized protein n=1 Tax=Apiospora phragmitis TaxID=2905665 RepID=A0ABR1TP76_9PEZI